MDGVLSLHKPAGMTSHDVVARVRRICSTKRAGHAGTLDPDATGVLVVAIGQATRLLPHLPIEPKVYVARVVFGLATDTEDASGKPIEEADASRLTQSAVLSVLPALTGDILQVPPMVSALHHEGRRLYDLAREGIVVERQPRPVVIHSLALSDFSPGSRAEATLHVVCGGGTYIRTLCADLGKLVGLPAHMKTLRREAVGPFHLPDALPLDALTEDAARAALIPLPRVLDWPAVYVSDEEAARLQNGQAISLLPPNNGGEEQEAVEVLLLWHGQLLALARREGRECVPFKVFSVENTTPPPVAVALGVFDGVHRGHQALLVAACEEAARLHAQTAALTFDPHPAFVFSPDAVPPLLGTLDERKKLLRKYGAEKIFVVPFDAAFAAQSPDDFVQNVLVKQCNTCAVVIGEDFRFGANRAGDAAFLREAGERHGFTVRVVPPVMVNGVPARSTRIREQIAQGNVEAARELLGRFYTLPGMVVHGRKMGRTLGYPTANVASPPGLLIPGAGVYAGIVTLTRTGERFRAAISVGTNPTVTPGADAPRTVEAFLLDGFSRDIYDEAVTVEFVAFVRPMVKFESLDALIEQMGRDVKVVRDMNVPA